MDSGRICFTIAWFADKQVQIWIQQSYTFHTELILNDALEIMLPSKLDLLLIMLSWKKNSYLLGKKKIKIMES